MCFFNLYTKKDVISLWPLFAQTDKPDSNQNQTNPNSKISDLVFKNVSVMKDLKKKCEYLLDARVPKKAITKAFLILDWILNWKQKEIPIRYITRGTTNISAQTVN